MAGHGKSNHLTGGNWRVVCNRVPCANSGMCLVICDCENGGPAQKALDGGVSSDIRIVRSPQGSYVVKRALNKLKVKADWFADPARSSNEVSGLRAMARLLGQEHVPRVLWEDRSGHQFAMELIDSRLQNWKVRLLCGDVSLATARTAARLLAELHSRSSAEPHLASQFKNTRPFIELRVQPFFERIAQRNPLLASAVTDVVERMQARRVALVHGDYSPKNLLVDQHEVVVLDCEVAHWGDPRFDVAFCAAHLILKSFRRTDSRAALLSAVGAFLWEYQRSGVAPLDCDLFRQLGCLMLARIEGDSPVDYLQDLDLSEVRKFATELIVRPSAWGHSDWGQVRNE
jgi:aminoglycoside phosphotransferase (APT) family kinase protein